MNKPMIIILSFIKACGLRMARNFDEIWGGFIKENKIKRKKTRFQQTEKILKKESNQDLEHEKKV